MYTDEEIKVIWSEIFLQKGYVKKIGILAESYPDEKSLYVSFKDIMDVNSEFADYILRDAERCILLGEEKIMDLLPSTFIAKELEERKDRINLRIYDIPSRIAQKDIRKLRSSHLGMLIKVRGIVKMVSEVRPRISHAAYICSECAGINIVEQKEFDRMRDPIKCEFCGKPKGKAKFTFSEEFSRFVDIQKATIQENPEDLRGGEQPQKILCYLEDDIAGEIYPGDRVTLNAILKARREKSTSQEYTLYLKVVSVEKEQSMEDIKLTDEDIKEIRELAKDPHIIEKLRDSIAPTIYGHEKIKEALALQMFGGVKKNIGGTTIRGDIHVLLVGDPGTAKTQLLRYMAKLAPRGWYAGGKMSTAAGLTATAVRDEEGRWTLEAGVLVLGDGGYVAIDEIDKIDKNELSAVLEAMESQTITVAKAGINAQLNARCSILAAANPKYGRFNPNMEIIPQIDLDPALLSRFDVIFKILDTPNEVEDERVARHMLETHYEGEKARAAEEGTIVTEPPGIKPPISHELFRKYVAYARNHIFPVMNDTVKDLIRRKYVELRRKSQDVNTIAITPRQLEAIIRFAEASARARLSEEVTEEDAERAISIVMFFIKDVVTTKEGVPDIAMLTSGIPSSKRQKISAVLSIIEELQKESGEAHYDEILRICAEKGIAYSEASEIIDRLHKEGRIIERTKGVYVLVG